MLGKRLAAISMLDQYRISNQVETYLARNPTRVKVTSHRIFHLVLKLSQILALGRDATVTRRIVPGSYENPRFLGYLDLEHDFVHDFTLQQRRLRVNARPHSCRAGRVSNLIAAPPSTACSALWVDSAAMEYSGTSRPRSRPCVP